MFACLQRRMLSFLVIYFISYLYRLYRAYSSPNTYVFIDITVTMQAPQIFVKVTNCDSFSTILLSTVAFIVIVAA